ncbi:hypothetical protein RhiirA1_474281 [Rhizophagus irregularis]|uniref:Uncharacterized protein n=2 Tax=Rhizophagus irregularis TaxID=588596 RepID=A0A2N0QYW8_9GLOM|nr:hypothetical protein RirG_125370 [Rhizophagus irregularis DAOM 197198w]PKC56243.1 hypothetical protein RhiirA1_474281 [Rhizophagus irregularis]
MSSELELLRQRITELEAENTKLRQIIEENSKREAENAEHKNLCFVGEEYISSVTAVSQPDTEPERHLALNDIPDPVIDQCVRIAKQHVADSSDIKSMEERETDAFLESKVIGPDNPPKANDYDDLYYDDPMSLSMKKGTNEIKLDDENDENDSEEEMPDESDNDDGYDGYGGYNEYGECDRGYYYRNRRYERKTSSMMSPIISPVTA